MIAQADKGNSMVVIKTQNYNQKLVEFISDNNFKNKNRSHQQISSNGQKSYKRKQILNYTNGKMEIHKSQPNTNYQRSDQDPQTSTSN